MSIRAVMFTGSLVNLKWMRKATACVKRETNKHATVNNPLVNDMKTIARAKMPTASSVLMRLEMGKDNRAAIEINRQL
jgi:hypothetical protein